MDERIRSLQRDASWGDPLLAVRVLRDRLRAGTLTAEQMELLAHLRHEPARVALGLPEPEPLVAMEAWTAWWRTFARAGRETGVRAAIALARPHLRMSVNGWRDRFAGVAEEAWHAAEALDAWVLEPTEERHRAASVAVTAAVEAPEPAGGVGILVPILGLMTSTTFEDALVQFGESTAYHWQRHSDPLKYVRNELVPWILGERDPIKTRDQDEGVHFATDPDISRSVSFSRDGRLVLSSSRGGAVTVRDAGTGATVREFERVRAEVFAAAFSPDATRVFAGGYWDPSRLLEVATGTVLRTFPQDEGINCCAFVDDVRVLAGGSDGKLKLWDTSTGAQLRVFEGHERGVKDVIVIPGGRVVTTGTDETLRVWDLESGAAIACWKQPGSVDSVALTPDEEHVLLGANGGEVALVALQDGAKIRGYQGAHGTVYAVAVVPGSSRFLSVIGGRGTEMRLWDAATGDVLRIWDDFHSLTFNIAVAPDARSFVTGGREGGLRRYTLVTPAPDARRDLDGTSP